MTAITKIISLLTKSVQVTNTYAFQRSLTSSNDSHSKLCPLCGYKIPSFTSLDDHLKRFHSKQINAWLRQDPETTYSKIFGNPGLKHGSYNMTWQDAIKITLFGKSKGLWYDSEKKVGGAPIDAIALYNNLSYLEALKLTPKLFEFKLEDLLNANNPIEPSSDLDNNSILELNDILREDPYSTYSKIFEDRRFKEKESTQLRWSGGIVVSKFGEKAGLWYDFQNGIGGGPLEAISHEKNVDLENAVKLAKEWFGVLPDIKEPKTKEEIQKDVQDKIEKKKQMEEKASVILKHKVQAVKDLWSKSVPVKDTVAFKYLHQHRKIPLSVIPELEFSFLRKGTKYFVWNEETKEFTEKTMSLPALAVPVENDKNEIVAIQRIFLNPKTGEKATKKAKFTMGNLKGHPAIIQRGQTKAAKLVLAEGPETAASIAAALISKGIVIKTMFTNSSWVKFGSKIL